MGDFNDDLATALVGLGPVYAVETVNEWLEEERCTRADAVATLRCLSAHAARSARMMVAASQTRLRAHREREVQEWARVADCVAGFGVEEFAAAAE